MPDNIKVIEIIGPSPAADWDAETSESIRLLKHNIGFQALCDKLGLQKSILESKLKQRQKELRDYDILQTGIFWLDYVKAFVDAEIGRNLRNQVPRDPFELEEQQFKRVSQALEIVGLNKSSGDHKSPSTQ